MARKIEFYEGSHSGIDLNEVKIVETLRDATDRQERSLGAAALPVHDIEYEWGPARHRRDAPIREIETPDDLSYSA